MHYFSAPFSNNLLVSEESYYQELFVLLVTSLALHPTADSRVSSLFRGDPLPYRPWRIVPYVLTVAALKACGPMHLFILIKTDNAPLHRTPPRNIQ
jgi:hypothetical protein